MIPAATLFPLMSLKVMRILPIRSSRLAAHMILAPIVCNLLLAGVLLGAAYLVGVKPGSEPLLTTALLAGALVVIAVPIILRWGLNWGTYLALFTAMMFVVGVSSFSFSLIGYRVHLGSGR